eukprot:NODE_6120_length_652_cov_4.260365_g5194_i0.p1 GENE.NODE_6120_length_652_cov_4.260365_g5194_i0~~NODE_6120_length_652_cov_4.260365_g5194_i0.p1  ORF type:complete len:96 (+),score=10.95 NODE_6120_length_652_cov_4.260365_g5194_i0:232-519(+)
MWRPADSFGMVPPSVADVSAGHGRLTFEAHGTPTAEPSSRAESVSTDHVMEVCMLRQELCVEGAVRSSWASKSLFSSEVLVRSSMTEVLVRSSST